MLVNNASNLCSSPLHDHAHFEIYMQLEGTLVKTVLTSCSHAKITTITNSKCARNVRQFPSTAVEINLTFRKQLSFQQQSIMIGSLQQL